MAKSISVAVGDSETMAAGSAFTVTVPVGVLTVTGKSVATDAGAVFVVVVAVVDPADDAWPVDGDDDAQAVASAPRATMIAPKRRDVTGVMSSSSWN
jgi:hypothetical protein